MRYIIETTKTEAGKRKIPMTEDVAMMFQAIIEDREPPKTEKVIDGYTGFLFYETTAIHLKRCIGNIASTIWWDDITISIECRCRTLRRMYADYLLFKYGEVRDESEDAAIPDGTFGYQRYDECVHAYQF